jgi:hydroxyproline O-galactosyltransferase 2/3/4/5/6
MPQADDDVFVRADALAGWLHTRPGSPGTRRLLYAGWIVRGAAPHRSGRWAVSTADYPAPAYPPYASGPAYLLSGALARRIVRAAAAAPPPIRLEDISVALWVFAVQVVCRVVGYSHRIVPFLLDYRTLDE